MPSPMQWTDAAVDRATGVLLASAAGDALGESYEFQPHPLPAGTPISMGGGHITVREIGEWTDDTQMTAVIVDAAERALANGERLLDRLDDLAADWFRWSKDATDVGLQTAMVLRAANENRPPSAVQLHAAAAHLAAQGRRTGGNGSLMRTAPVALAYLGDPESIVTAARAISDLTHADPDAGDACVLQCLAIDRAVRTGELDLRTGLDALAPDRRDRWGGLLAEAETSPADDFANNGWVVHAMQAAWSLICRTPAAPDDPTSHLRLVLEAACRLRMDTDTVAAIAGALVGARWGASAVPQEWRDVVHGWPGLTGDELAARGVSLARAVIGGAPA
jgi:ADP-ribosyl-[dinitrogen reductase] hydrolase